jgi:hypothetical protein
MRDDQTVAIAQHFWKIGRKPKIKTCPSQNLSARSGDAIRTELVSFPKIISARSDDAIQTELVWQ